MEDIYSKITDPDEYGIDTNEESEIQKFYANETIFLTGCTGFIGKCVVEKLLRSCPDLKKLYIMIRSKKSSPNERIKKYFDDILFQKLRQLNPNFESKIVVIEGNLENENILLSNDDKDKIINESTIIIHNASNVKFEAKLSESLMCNVIGTKKMLDLAKQCKNLKVFVYVSTAYSHCYEKKIFEKSYSPPGDLKIIQDYIDVDRNTKNGMSNEAKKIALSPWPNVYIYSKAMAEYLVEQCAKQVSFRCTIYRPSIVISTYQEPIKSWVDNINGPVLAFAAIGLGIAHIGYNLKNTFDMVPADMCTNGLLATTWDSVENRKECGSVLIYNYGSSVVNPIDMMSFETLVTPRGRETPSNKMVGPHFTHATHSVLIFILGHIFCHFIPAVIADIALLITGKKTRAVSIFLKTLVWLTTIFRFANGNWRIYVNETQKVWDKMNKRDNELFYNDLRTLKWDLYAYSYWTGLRVYIIKDSMDTLDKALKRYHIIQKIFKIFCGLLILGFLYYFDRYFLMLFNVFYDAAGILCQHCQKN